MLLDNWLAQRALTCPDRLAVCGEGTQLTYLELEREATSAARRLAAKGVRRDALVVIRLRPCVEHVVALHALMKVGAIAYPVSTQLTEAELQAELDRTQPALVLSGADGAGLTEADLPLLGEHDLDGIHCLIGTSGTSGERRTVELTYGNHLWSAVGSAFNIGVEPTDRWLCCLPMHHVSGLSIAMRSVIYGTGMVVHDGFDVDRVGESLEGDGVTIVSVVATQLVRLLEAGIDLLPLRAVLVGGGPVPVEVLEEAIGRGATVVQTYGMTETASQVTTLAPGDARRKLGSAGRPLLTTHLRIDGGEILVQGPTVAPGAADEDGWLHTGDLGRIDEDGFLYVEDRIGDLIISGGENVVPAEVEAVLLRHPDVADVGAVGRQDDEWQEAVVAVVVLREGSSPDPDELRRHCAEHLAPFKVPKRFEFASELPRTAAGKLLRRRLR
ncbi:MAG: o-succinylbenzoate---CoA ligase [Solirubrobacterales bacterium]|jgi:O-succinylbenzoic acid--CoA ligase|nr:o-succinylbenzoate---CoA ligase [Solirubrobacterales bacterium]